MNVNLAYSLCWLLYASQQLVSDEYRRYRIEQYNVEPTLNLKSKSKLEMKTQNPIALHCKQCGSFAEPYIWRWLCEANMKNINLQIDGTKLTEPMMIPASGPYHI